MDADGTQAQPLPAVTAAAVAAARRALADDAAVTVRETHMSVVLVGDERVFKVRRAVAFAFADHSTLAARRASADAELTLNSELAEGIYIDVHAVLETADGPMLADRDDPAAVDYVVEMRRFDERETLAARLDAGACNEQLETPIDRLGSRLAEFHTGAPPDLAAPRDPASAASKLIWLVGTEVAELVGLLVDTSSRESVVRVGNRLESAALGRADELAGRAVDGLVREVHGDLRAEHVLVGGDGSVAIVDRLEYRRDLRTIDVADDLAFLIMDLVDRDRRELGDRLCESYVAAGGTVVSAALLALYGSRRALIRAKVELLRAGQGGRDAPLARSRADHLLGTARRLAWQTHGTRAIVFCGGSGAGKSHLAAAVSEVSGLPVLSSDLIRKELLGLAPTERGGPEAYAEAVTQRVYAELGMRARAAVGEGLPVIADATCLRRVDRDALRDGLREYAEAVVFIECVAADDVIAARVAARIGDPGRVSDATADVVERQRSRREPLDEVPAGAHVVLRTDRDTQACVAALETAL